MAIIAEKAAETGAGEDARTTAGLETGATLRGQCRLAPEFV
jgi:hypothetical protein